ncbi:hypothetical protein MRY87_11445 [bacterium]|nr:hypothetical protein [bacterium]
MRLVAFFSLGFFLCCSPSFLLAAPGEVVSVEKSVLSCSSNESVSVRGKGSADDFRIVSAKSFPEDGPLYLYGDDINSALVFKNLYQAQASKWLDEVCRIEVQAELVAQLKAEVEEEALLECELSMLDQIECNSSGCPAGGECLSEIRKGKCRLERPAAAELKPVLKSLGGFSSQPVPHQKVGFVANCDLTIKAAAYGVGEVGCGQCCEEAVLEQRFQDLF